MAYEVLPTAGAQRDLEAIDDYITEVEGRARADHVLDRCWSGSRVYPSRLDFGGGSISRLRAVVDASADPVVVVTVYRTSKINRYWRT